MRLSDRLRARSWLSVAALLAGFSAMSCSARADVPIQWKASDGGNDHYYEFVDFGVNTSWTTARDYAANQVYLGLAGHLVTEGSQAEDDFLHANFGQFIGDPGTGVPGIYAWIGLTDIGSTGSFHWITGEPLTYTNWAPPEPNFIGIEHYGHLWIRKFTGTDVDPNGTPIWSWNNAIDAPFGSDPSAYQGAIIEFDGLGTPAVPEPSSLVIALLAGSTMLAFRFGLEVGRAGPRSACLVDHSRSDVDYCGPAWESQFPH
jgi:hypothetical protein